jgi:tetratricopeptide (TPR) repeat protein
MAVRTMSDDGERWEAVEDATERLVEGDARGAVELLAPVIAADPANAYAFHYLGVALFELGELGPARDAFGAALRLSPRYLGARVARSHALRMLGDAEAAREDALVAITDFPADGDALHALGLAHAALGERSNAIAALERFLAVGPELEVRMEAQGLLDALRQLPEGEPLHWKIP